MYERLKNKISNALNAKDYVVYFLKINSCLARASATAAIRQIDPQSFLSWEFSGFSQNGEDGIIDYLISRMNCPTKKSIEFGANNGVDNCTAWLAVAKRYQSVMVEGSKTNARRAQFLLNFFQGYHYVENMFIDLENIRDFADKYADFKDHDVFSIDIDSYDYHIAKRFLELGFRPRIIVSEFNSVFGPDRPITVPYIKDFWHVREAGNLHEYYWGASVEAYRTLFESFGYKMLGIESSGVNCIFILPEHFDSGFIENLKPDKKFRENFSTVWSSRGSHIDQFSKIKDMEFEYVR